MTNSALEVKNLTKDYGDFVLDKLNFTLPRGVIMGLIGENGAGKPTTINCILNEIINYASKIHVKRLWLNSSEQGKKLYVERGFIKKENEMELFL